MRQATFEIVETEPMPSGASPAYGKGGDPRPGVRDADESDLPAMLDMGRRFIEQAWTRVGVGYCEASCTALLGALMADHLLLIAPDRSGMIGVMVHPWHFNHAVQTATELFWWSEGEFGGALLNEAIARLRALGVPTLNMACEHHMRSPALDRLYRAKGFVPSEHIYIMDLR